MHVKHVVQTQNWASMMISDAMIIGIQKIFRAKVEGFLKTSVLQKYGFPSFMVLKKLNA